MKKSFYELYLERQVPQNDIQQDVPKIRSPSKVKIVISYYISQIIKISIIVLICIFAIVGIIAICNTNIRNQILELLFGSSFLMKGVFKI